ncbi:MAG: hypothetical protein R3D27_12970 [Hyphomicrobiaceae bacterium]
MYQAIVEPTCAGQVPSPLDFQSAIGWKTPALSAAIDQRFVAVLDEKLLALAERHIEQAWAQAIFLLSESHRQQLARNPWVSDGLLRVDGPVVVSRALQDEIIRLLSTNKQTPKNALEIDFDVPYAIPSSNSPPSLSDYKTLPIAHQAKISSLIIELEERLRASNCVVLDFIQRHTHVLSIRLDTTVSQFCSGTFDRHVGLSLLTCWPTFDVSVIRLLDAIAHESIHNFLFKCEAIHGSFVASDSARRLPMISPWSGNTISLYSFTHACSANRKK